MKSVSRANDFPKLRRHGSNGPDHSDTIRHAHTALEHIAALALPANPAIYELWYTFATGCNPPLNKEIEETIAGSGELSLADAEELHRRYFCLSKSEEQLDAVRTTVVSVASEIETVIEASVGAVAQYKDHLTGASRKLNRVNDREDLSAIVEALNAVTRDAERSNQELHIRLTASKKEIEKLHTCLDAVRSESRTDILTNIFNRRYFDEAIAGAVRKSTEPGRPLSLLMLDIDHFKAFNDSYGHTTGDQVLQLVAGLLKSNVRGQDIPARYGGEEFAVILPNTRLPQACSVAENVRKAVVEKELIRRSTRQLLGRVSVSIGVAELRPGECAADLIERADRWLYKAKADGRDRVRPDGSSSPGRPAN